MYICNNINNSIRKNSHSSYQTSEHQHDDKLNISDAKTKQYISSLVGFKESHHQPSFTNTVLIKKLWVKIASHTPKKVNYHFTVSTYCWTNTMTMSWGRRKMC